MAQEGGPSHRATTLCAPAAPDVSSPAYAEAVAEIVRGIFEVSGLRAAAAEPGWIAVTCPSAAMATWLGEAIAAENVQARVDDRQLYLPVGEQFGLKAEIKSVITVVAKTTHYWQDHIPAEIKRTLQLQAWLERVRRRFWG